MPALVGPLVGFALGVALCWLAREDAARGEERGLGVRGAIAALFGILVFAPAAAYFLIFAGDWSLGYLVDSRLVPSAVGLGLCLVDAASVPLGYLAARRAGRRATRAMIALGASPALVALGVVLALYPRLRLEGTFHQVKGDFGVQPVSGSPTGWAILWMNAMILAGFAVAARALTQRTARATKGDEETVTAANEEAPHQGFLGRRGRR